MPGACVREEHSESFCMAMLDTRVNGGEDIRAGSESRAALGGKTAASSTSESARKIWKACRGVECAQQGLKVGIRINGRKFSSRALGSTSAQVAILARSYLF